MSHVTNAQAHSTDSGSFKRKRISALAFFIISFVVLLITPLLVDGAQVQPKIDNNISPTLDSSQSKQTQSEVLLVGIKQGNTPTLTAITPAVIDRLGVSKYEEILNTINVEGFLENKYVSSQIEDSIKVFRVVLSSNTNSRQMIAQLNADPNVVFVEPDYLAHLIAIPSDPLYPGQWGLDKIKAPIVWDTQMGDANVVIALIDAGMDVNHPDLAGKLWTNAGEIADNSLDDDNNGYIDDIHGWNMVDDNPNLSDNTGHGTEVAGVAAANTDNAVGVAGVCGGCQIMVIKVTQNGGVANYSDIIEAINYASQKGADVINLSLGGNSDSISLRTAVESASETAVVVGGAGNDNAEAFFYPAAYDAVLSVAGTTQTDTKVSTSNYGTWVNVSAPGEMITTTFDGGSYGMTSGTSMAAPFVSGLAGLLRSQHTDWSADTARAHIMRTTENIDGLNPSLVGKMGSGRIDAAQAFATTPEPLLSLAGYTVDDVENGRPEPGSTFDLDVSLVNEWADATNVQATLTSSDPYVIIVNGAANYSNIDTFNSETNLTPFQVSIANNMPYAHELNFSLNITADGGYVTAVPVTVTTASGIEQVSGLISVDTIWSNDKQYLITGNTLVQPGITLTIEPGTSIRVDSDFVLRIDGNLIANGLASQPIIFTSNKAAPNQNDWLGIEVGNSGSIEISQCEISFATTAVNSSLNNSLDTISNCYIHHNVNGIITDHDTIFSNKISHNFDFGINVENSDTPIPAAITKNEIAYSGNIAIHHGGNGDGFISGNLIHNNEKGFHGEIGATGGKIISNTIMLNNFGIDYIDYSTAPTNNNLWGNYTFALQHRGTQNVAVPHNWWGTIDASLIDQQIYDFLDDFNLGSVTYTPFLSEPVSDAPAYVHNISVLPESPIGIETAAFDLHFSRPMDQSSDPDVVFHNVKYNTWDIYQPYDFISQVAVDSNNGKWVATYGAGVSYFDGSTWTSYNPNNSGLPGYFINAIAVESDDSLWVSTSDSGVAHFNGSTWKVYNESNSSLPHNTVDAIAIEADGTKWFGTLNGVARFNDSGWTVFNTTNSPLPHNRVFTIDTDTDGTKWFGTLGGGLAKLHGNTWEIFNTSNSNLPENDIYAIAGDGIKWIGTESEGLARFQGGIWTVYTTTNSDLPANSVSDIYLHHDDTIWLGTSGGAVHIDEDEWMIYNVSNSDLPSDDVRSVILDKNNDTWFGTMTGNTSGGVAVLYSGVTFPIIDNVRWVDSSHWQGSFDITSMVPRGEYSVTVRSAIGTDGMQIVPDSRFGFTVDYAGEITNDTPPEAPSPLASGVSGDASSFEATWFTPDSDITNYRYAVGSAPGATDIINWTTTNETSVQLSGLGLVEGQKYWFMVQAQNPGGLWSETAMSNFISGQELFRVFLPTIIR